MKYPKIQTIYKRDPVTNYKTLLEGDFSLPEFEYLQHNRWVFTEKVDGTNIRVIWKDGKLNFAGRTDRVDIPRPLGDALLELFDVEKMRHVFDDSHAILYGEGYGPKIHGGDKYLNTPSFVLFDVLIGGIWMRRESIESIANDLGIDDVPVRGIGSLHDLVKMVRDGFVSGWGDFTAEGIVARPDADLLTRTGERIITKLKHKDFPTSSAV